MSKKRNSPIDLERKIEKVFLENPNKEFNYKQISATLKVSDTKTRNEIIKTISKMTKKKRLLSPERGKYSLNNNQNNKVKSGFNLEKKDYPQAIFGKQLIVNLQKIV